ncbi:MAG: hypothetical protein KIT10_02075 [Flavobacteriales bacterium]|nr:hypothetical protein [Flavobacteriales bacterium]
MWSLEHLPGRTIALHDAEARDLGTLRYPSIWSSRAEITVAGGLYIVKRKPGLTTALWVMVGDVPVWEIRFGWRGIQFHRPGNTEQLFLVVRPSAWQERYALQDISGRVMLRLQARMSWRQLERRFSIIEMGGPAPEPLLVLLALHAVIMRQRRNAAMTTAT